MTTWYIPQFSYGLLLRLLLCLALAAVLFAYARERHGSLCSAGFILGGWLIAVLPKISIAIIENDRFYGAWARRSNNSELPDWFWELFAYFDIGWGTAASVVGLVGGWLAFAGVSFFARRAKAVSPVENTWEQL